ncbi:MAG: transporter substrate-binding domain-containing protein [Chthoniobacteraceae bacterium]
MLIGFLAFEGPLARCEDQNAQSAPWEQYKIQLTPEEVAWIKAHPVVRVGFDPAWPPFSFRDANGALQGIDFDLLKRLERQFGIRFEPVPTNSWEETEQKILGGNVDMVTGTSRTEGREKYLLFTSTYTSTSLAVITRQEAPFLTGLHNLKGVTLASPRGYVTTDKLIQDYPTLPLIQTATALEALQLVSHKKADVAIENLAAASYLIKSDKLTNLKIAGIADYHFDLCLAVRKDLPELRDILQKAIDSISVAERSEMFDHWTAVEYFPHSDWTRVWKIGALLLGVTMAGLVVFAWWNRRLACELEARRKAEAELTVAHDRLHDLNKEKDRFMRMAAHDLNNPLSAILIQCGVCEMEGDYSPDRMQEVIASVQSHSQRMTHLINNLLNADKIEQGKMKLEARPVDLNAVAADTVQSLKPGAESKTIRIDFTPSPFPVSAIGDRNAMLQVMENLLSNAIKFTPPGKAVTVRVCETDGMARIEVSDQGPGITEEDRPRLFEKYATLSARPTGNEPSHGLGLSIAKRLVESMHGVLRCESAPGKGAMFWVEFEAVGMVKAGAN